MTWLKKDDRFPEHRKMRRLSDGAYRLHDTALCACAKDETDGMVTETDIADMQHGDRLRKYVPALVEAGLWEVVEGGWEIHDFLHYNPSHAKEEERRARDRKRQEDRRERQVAGRSRDDAPGITSGSRREIEESDSDWSDDHYSNPDNTRSHVDVSRRDSHVSHGAVTRESQAPVPSRPVPSRSPQSQVANASFDPAQLADVLDLNRAVR